MNIFLCFSHFHPQGLSVVFQKKVLESSMISPRSASEWPGSYRGTGPLQARALPRPARQREAGLPGTRGHRRRRAR